VRVHCLVMPRSAIRAPRSITLFYLAFLTYIGYYDRSRDPNGNSFSRVGAKPYSIGRLIPPSLGKAKIRVTKALSRYLIRRFTRRESSYV